MELTGLESKVVQRLRRKRVATMNALRDDLDVSHMTVVRALKKYGYHTSVNHNAMFYTLQDIPRFDDEGLWHHNRICFSIHRTLDKTLVALVRNSSAGITVAELEERLNTKVGNLLSRLCGQEKLARCFYGRHAVYVAVARQHQRRQRDQREQLQQEAQAAVASSHGDKSTFPADCDVVVVLEILIQIINTPQADAAALAKAVRTRGVTIRAAQVQRVLDFYALQKKRDTRRR